MPNGTTWIHFEHDRTKFMAPDGTEVEVPIGAGAIAQRLFRHDPPTSGELEQAIDQVEDALASTGLRHGERGDLKTSEPNLLEQLGLRDGRARAARDEVELEFERIASAALGRPAAPDPSRVGAATLLILRECMHHLGYKGVLRGERWDSSPPR